MSSQRPSRSREKPLTELSFEELVGAAIVLRRQVRELQEKGSDYTTAVAVAASERGWEFEHAMHLLVSYAPSERRNVAWSTRPPREEGDTPR